MNHYITLQQAAEALPTHTSHTTLWRWCTKGIVLRSLDQTVRLEHMYIGRRMVTTRKWLDEFIEQVSAARKAKHRAGGLPGRKFSRAMELMHAEAVLRRAGI